MKKGNLKTSPVMKEFILCLMPVCLLMFFLYANESVAASSRIQVIVEGVEGEIKQNVLSFLSIEKQKDFDGLSDGFIRELHEKAPDEIRSAMQPFGYYNPIIRSSLKLVEETWHAVYEIDKGEPVVVRELDLRLSGAGSGDRIFTRAVEEFPLKKGDILRHQEYEKGKRGLQQAAREYGYLDAVFTVHRVSVFPEVNAADVTIHFDTGARYRFGTVSFHQDTFSPELLQRFVPFKKGDPYVVMKIFQFQSALRNSGYFSTVEVNTLSDRPEGHEVPVEVTLAPVKRNRYSFGIGYGTDTGVRGSVGWENRYVNRRGHKMNAEARVSEIEDGVTSRYIIPLKSTGPDHLDFTAGWERQHSETADSKGMLAGVGLNQARRSWTRTVYLNYQLEDFEVADQSGRTSLLLPGITFTQIKADDRIYASSGRRIIFDIKGAHTALLSDVSLLQAVVQGRFIKAVGGFGRLIVRGKAGSTVVDDFEDVPVSLRFFAGGDQSIRGYDYNSLGPVNDEGDVIGGRNILVGSMEYEQNIT
ncbi:MAG: outer membrane protein assembly factor, partial [Nitrospiraceae bacterium]